MLSNQKSAIQMLDGTTDNRIEGTVNLLLVDDDKVDLIGLQRAFKKLGLCHPIHIAKDGVEALHLLRGSDSTSPIPKPHLIVLDLNMPRMNGIEFLKEIRHDTALSDAVVFVLTTSSDRNDVKCAYDQHVSGYIVKSGRDHSFAEVANLIGRYCDIVSFP